MSQCLSARLAKALTIGALVTLWGVAPVSAQGTAMDGTGTHERKRDSFDYLINEPATLLDIGVMKMRMDMKAAARRLYDGGYVSREPVSGAYYDFRAKGLFLYVSVHEPLAAPTAAQCMEAFAHVQRSVLGTHPKGPNQAKYYLESIFGHEFFPRTDRPDTLIDDIADSTRLEIVVLPPDPMRGGKKVACSGRLDASIDELDMEPAT